MNIRDFIWIFLVVALNFLIAVFAEIEFVRFVQFQLISSVMLALAYPKGWIYLLIIGLTFFGDIAFGYSFGLSALVFCAGGVLISLISKQLPILKQRPFWLARNFWLAAALLILCLLNRDGIEAAILYLAVNLAIMNLLTLVTRKLRPANVDIFIN